MNHFSISSYFSFSSIFFRVVSHRDFYKDYCIVVCLVLSVASALLRSSQPGFLISHSLTSHCFSFHAHVIKPHKKIKHNKFLQNCLLLVSLFPFQQSEKGNSTLPPFCFVLDYKHIFLYKKVQDAYLIWYSSSS
jgi:hypothetical protein